MTSHKRETGNPSFADTRDAYQDLYDENEDFEDAHHEDGDEHPLNLSRQNNNNNNNNYELSFSSNSVNFAEKRRKKRIMVLVVVSLLLIVLVIAAYTLSILVPRLIARFKNRGIQQKCSFSAIVLGNYGGLTEENLSSVLISHNASNAFLALDAGSLLYGLRAFLNANNMLSNNYAQSNTYLSFPFPDWTLGNEMARAGFILRNHIWGYLLGHAHLDHINGLVIDSPEDFFTDVDQMIDNTTKRAKPIVGLNSTLQTLQEDVFNGRLWPDLPKITKQYWYEQVNADEIYQVNDLLALNPNIRHPILYEQWKDITVKVYRLCHENLNSTAFLFDSAAESNQLIYFSDTGVSSSTTDQQCNWQDVLNSIWSDAALNPQILSAIFIELSASDESPISKMYGHLRPVDLIKSLSYLKTIRSMDSLSHIKVIINHIKPSFNAGEDPSIRIKTQIDNDAKTFGVDAQFIFPSQGDYICL